MIVNCAIGIYHAYQGSVLLGSVVVVYVNFVTPVLVKYYTSWEPHESETSFATSVYIKVTLIRWVNTALVTYIITPLTDYLEAGKLTTTIRALFIAELFQRPILQLIDWMGQLKRHVLGPRAPDQRRSKLIMLLQN